MKKFYIVFFSFLIGSSANAQPYLNEWIYFQVNAPYSVQQYLKVKVWQHGIHRLSYSDINQFIPASSFQPHQIQIFHNGKEQFIYVAGESDSVFNTTDYVEFYAKRNDGSIDSLVYDSLHFQLNPYYNLFNDTAAYFLTINANALTQNKRMVVESDNNFSPYSPSPYFLKESLNEFHSQYAIGTDGYSINASYIKGEGFTGDRFGNDITISLGVPNAMTSAGLNAEAFSAFLCQNSQESVWEVKVNGTLIGTAFNYRYTFTPVSGLIPASDLSSQSAVFSYTKVGNPFTQSNSVPYVRIVYPHKYDSFNNENGNNYKFRIVSSTTDSKTLLNISNYPLGTNTTRWIYLFNGANASDSVKKITTYPNGSLLQALAPTFFQDRYALISSDQTVITNSGFSIQPVSTDPAHFARFTYYAYQSLINTDYLMITHPLLWNKADEYKNYRASAAGGNFNVLVADINELYDQFAYGINQNPLSVKNFCRFAKDHLDSLRYVFLFGKSLRSDDVRLIPSFYQFNLVPTYGNPPSDQIMVSDAQGDTLFIPRMAVGRLAARNVADVDMYLDKVKSHDAQHNSTPQEWMKRVLHFGGGRTAYEQSQIKQHLDDYKKIIEDTLFGGHVTTFLKNTTDPIQINLSSYLQALIDDGTSLMTFFAHASGSTFDITTDIPENYNNPDKYPVMVANSCYVGDMHVIERQYSERFIFQNKKGAIAFIASPNVGYIPEQPAYTIPLYQQISSLSYGMGIGLCMKNAIPDVNYGDWEDTKSLTMGMTLHGDPAIRLYSQDLPDLQVKQQQISFSPAQVASNLSTFDIKIAIKNLGKAINAPYVVRVTRLFPDGFTPWVAETILTKMPFVDTLVMTVPMNFLHASGLNKFSVFVDAENFISPEISEANNDAATQLFIQSGDIVPVFPSKYSIIPNNAVTLKASTSDLLAPLLTYRFQLDTTDRFTSPLAFGDVSSKGGIVSWQVPFQVASDRVYYWRVANKQILTDTITYKWNESTFIYIPGKTGWSQAHYSQFKEDKYQNVVFTNEGAWTDTTFTFIEVQKSITCHTAAIFSYLTSPADYFIDNLQGDYAGCPDMLYMAVLDSITVEPWSNKDYDLGNFNKFLPDIFKSVGCGIQENWRQRPENFFYYPTTNTAYFDSLSMAINNSIPNGNYILIFTTNYPRFDTWPPALRQSLENMGSQIVNTSTVPHWKLPFIFFAKKGDISSKLEILGDTLPPNDKIVLNASIGGNWDKGFISSVKIGPAAQWSEVHWDQFSVDPIPNQDSIHLQVIGIDTLNFETVLMDSIPFATPDFPINSINAAQYPYLKLKAYMQDEQKRSPPQLSKWQIYFTEVPEGALNPQIHFSFSPSDTLDEGNSFHLEMAFENISTADFSDSMVVDFYVYDGNNNRIDIGSPKYKKLNSGDYFIASTTFNTLGHAGLNSLWIEANPLKSTHLQEQYHFNNITAQYFKVNRDITNPILDVTFDGVHILNGDIVSSKPQILIRMKDENKFITLQDTAKYRIYLSDSTGNSKRIYFEPAPNMSTGNEKLKWSPASLPDNTFVMEFYPYFPVDGVYSLDVQGSDEAGNLSGQFSYKISFEVINKSTITEIINYPNPFSTSTRFVFVLTGSEIPTGMRIQIMTITGKIVRTILQHELGPIHIGRNITQYAWDGRDEFGDQLANGVYLYRVTTDLNGKSIEHRETEADRYFKKGWGKMYLMR